MKKKFNNRNLKKFANNLYSEDDEGNIEYVPLCYGTLAKMNGEMTHCVLGEMYEYFTGKPIARINIQNFTITYKDETGICEELVKLGSFKEFIKEAGITNTELAHNIYKYTVNENDKGLRGNGERAQIERAKRVKKSCIEFANIYLER